MNDPASTETPANDGSGNTDAAEPKITTLTETQRRVLGTLLEKAFTTPASYPLTLNALLTGCNQKSNREPVVAYDDDDIEMALDELAELDLVKTIYPESGYANRYRHLARQAFEFTEPQLAIVTELWLRGRQSLGDLRSRASRMVPISSLDVLREELKGLLDAGCIETDGPLGKRGVQVDHTFYEDHERPKRSEPTSQPESDTPAKTEFAKSSDSDTDFDPALLDDAGEADAARSPWANRIELLEGVVRQLLNDKQELRDELLELRGRHMDLHDRFEQLRSEVMG